jgi:hypothetical protein
MSDEGVESEGPFESNMILLEQLNDSVRQAAEIVERGRLAQEERIAQAEADQEARREEHDELLGRQRRNLFVLVGLVVGLSLVIAVSFSLWSIRTSSHAHDAAQTAQDAADAATEALAISEAEREARTLGACEAQRSQALDSIEKDRNHIADVTADRALFSALLAAASSTANPNSIAVTEAYVAEKDRIIAEIEAAQAAVRICSPEAIEAYFASGGTEGIEPPADLTPEG